MFYINNTFFTYFFLQFHVFLTYCLVSQALLELHIVYLIVIVFHFARFELFFLKLLHEKLYDKIYWFKDLQKGHYDLA